MSKKPIRDTLSSMPPPLVLREADPQTQAWVHGLEKAARIRLTPELRRRLLELLNDYLAARRKAPDTPNRKLKGRLRPLVTHARRLAELLDPPDLAGVDALWWAARGMPGRFFDHDAASLKHRLEQLAAGAELALAEGAEREPGRPSGELETWLIRQLHGLYLAAGGEGTGAYYDEYSGSERGRFLALVEAVWNGVRGPSLTRSRLGRRIRAALE